MFCRSVKRQSESEEEREFLRQKEAESVAVAALTAALGKSDAGYIYEHLMPDVPRSARTFPRVMSLFPGLITQPSRVPCHVWTCYIYL